MIKGRSGLLDVFDEFVILLFHKAHCFNKKYVAHLYGLPYESYTQKECPTLFLNLALW